MFLPFWCLIFGADDAQSDVVSVRYGQANYRADVERAVYGDQKARFRVALVDFKRAGGNVSHLDKTIKDAGIEGLSGDFLSIDDVDLEKTQRALMTIQDIEEKVCIGATLFLLQFDRLPEYLTLACLREDWQNFSKALRDFLNAREESDILIARKKHEPSFTSSKLAEIEGWKKCEQAIRPVFSLIEQLRFEDTQLVRYMLKFSLRAAGYIKPDDVFKVDSEQAKLEEQCRDFLLENSVQSCDQSWTTLESWVLWQNRCFYFFSGLAIVLNVVDIWCGAYCNAYNYQILKPLATFFTLIPLFLKWRIDKNTKEIDRDKAQYKQKMNPIFSEFAHLFSIYILVSNREKSEDEEFRGAFLLNYYLTVSKGFFSTLTNEKVDPLYLYERMR